MVLRAPILLDRAVFAIGGSEAESFLNNLLTQDVARLKRQSAIYAGLLTPQGKVAFDFILWRTPSGFLVDIAQGRAAALIARLTLYRLRANVDIGAVQTNVGVFAASEGAAPDPRLAALGARTIGATASPAPIEEPATYRQLRLSLGVPEPAHDDPASEAFALELLFEELNGVDFKKGCFVGQENVSRMKRRATTRRKICPIDFDGDAPPFGAIISAGSSEIGVVRTSAGSRALAMVRLDRAAEARARSAPLTVAGRLVTLAPPAWLLQPATETP